MKTFLVAPIVSLPALLSLTNAHALGLWAQDPEHLFSIGAAVDPDFGEDLSAAADFDADGSPDIWVSNDGGDGGVFEARLYSLVDGALLRTVTDPAAHFGHTVETVGDIDGDQVPDYIVGAPQANTNRGLAQVRSGFDDSVIRTHFAAGTAYDDRFGNSVAALGDVNQDGVPDYAITASSEDPVGSSAHYVGSIRFFSGADGSELSFVMGSGGSHYAGSCTPGRDYDGDGLIEVVNGSNGGYVRIHDDTGVIALEIAHGMSGDVDGVLLDDHDADGFGDVLVHSHQSGLLRIFSSSDGSLIREIAPPSGLTFTSSGREHVTNFCAIADRDGDGHDDIVFGEHAAQRVVILGSVSGAVISELQHPATPGASFGHVVRYLDAEKRLLVTSISESVHVFSTAPNDPAQFTPVYELDGSPSELRFGSSLAVGEDLDGDGSVDIAIGTGSECVSEDSIRTFSGANGDTIWVDAYTGSSCHVLGRSAAFVGDLDGDGLSEIVSGAPQANGNCGIALVLSGADGSVLHQINGACTAPDDRFGSGAGRLADITGDGVPEYLVAASSADPCCGHYVGTIQAFDGATHQPVWQANGSASYDYARIRSGGDFNGDGVPDVAWHSSQHGFSPVGPGYIRVLDGLTGASLIEISGSAIDDHFGDAFAIIGDVNSDGIRDLAIGVPQGDTFAPDAGEIRVISGLDQSVLYVVEALPAAVSIGHSYFSGEDRGSMCLLPDMDHDGVQDFACGQALAENANSESTGAVCIYSGATGEVIQVLWGASAGDLFGEQVRYSDSLLANGGGALVVSAPLHDGGRGRAYVFGLPADCDGNGVNDSTQIAADPSLDWNGDGLIDGCAGGGVVYCDGNLNAAGLVGRIAPQGSPLVADDAFTLYASDLPLGQPGMFIMSRASGYVNPFGGGAGVLCLGPPIRRFNPTAGFPLQFTGATGEITLTPPIAQFPGPNPIQPGDVIYFQLWHREFDTSTGVPRSNTTDGISVMFR